ncbi:MAG: glycosyltransferase [Anaerolineae bacterium]|nr:glycosyltransferase [Anaerolineae bacterium]
MKIALVHDWLNQMGGAEDVLLELARMYPDSPIYTSIFAPEALPPAFAQLPIQTLWMDKLPAIHTHHQPYLPLYPLAWGGLTVRGHDVVLTNKSGFCHGLRVEGGVQVCYCLAPTRYVWQFEHYVAREGLGGLVQAALRPLVALMKRWDYAAAQRVGHFIAISTEIQARIKQYYDRDSVIIFPPVDTDRFAAARTDAVGDYYLVVSRLIPYKRIDLAVRACTALGLPLKVGGRGRDLESLKAIAGPTVEFLGYVPDDDLPALMAGCKAFLFPGLEDFGITPVQAQAAGRPVIAYGGGGALDTVRPGVTGELFDAMTVEALMATLQAFDPARYDPEACQAHARTFDTRVFRAELGAFLHHVTADSQQR